MSLYIVALALVIFANVGYHLSQRSIRTDVDPFASLIVTYGVALAVSVALWPYLGQATKLGPALRQVGTPSYVLGAFIVLLELGYLLAYRTGWQMGTTALYANGAVAIILLPLGAMYFGEGLDVRKLLGFVLTIAGLGLLTRPTGG